MNQILIRELLAEHASSKKALTHYKDKERKLRDKIVSMIFPTPKTGTNKVSFKELGLEVKAILKDTWSVKQDGLDEIMSEYESIHAAFKYKYDLVMAGYKALSDEDKKILADTVTCKQGAPELSYEGELGESHLKALKVDNDILLVNNALAGPIIVNQTASYYGFNDADDFLTFLEEIQ